MGFKKFIVGQYFNTDLVDVNRSFPGCLFQAILISFTLIFYVTMIILSIYESK